VDVRTRRGLRWLGMAVAALAIGSAALTFAPRRECRELDGLSGEALATALGAWARAGHRPLRYDRLWEALEETDAAPSTPGAVVLFYSGRVHPKADKVSGRLNPDYGPDSWNREHLWPRSRGLGPEDGVAFSDLHHVRAVDITCNEERGARDFAHGGTPLAECRARRDGDSFEPRAEIRGDLARMLFYMDVRYAGRDGEPDLRLVDGVGAGEAASLGELCALVSWHRNDPADAHERARHERIVELQGNRNPFVERPELATRLYAPRCADDR